MPELERILKDTPGTLSQQWYEDGVAVDAGTVTIGIVRADGTELVAAGTGTNGSGTSPRTFSVTTAHTAALDRFTVTWSSSAKGEAVTYLEVGGGFVFSVSELMALKPANLTWTAAQVTEMRTTVEEAIEVEYGTALVPRYALETVMAPPGGALQLRSPVRAVRSVTPVGGTAYTATELESLYVAGGLLIGAWPSPPVSVTVGYEYGLPHPPARIKQAALLLARQWLVKGPIDDRTTVMASPDSGITATLAIPGRGGSIFGLPELDAAIMSSSYRIGVA